MRTRAKSEAREWTQKELEYLLREFPNRPTAELAEHLGRTAQSVACRAGKYGLKKRHRGTEWTPRMLKLLTDFYPIMFNKPLARWIGVSTTSLLRKAQALGIRKPEGYMQSRRKDISALQSEGLKRSKKTGGRIQPGQHRSPATEFKPGHQLTPEQAEKRAAACREAWVRRRQREQFRNDYKINCK